MFGPRLTAVTLTLCVAVGLKASPVLIQSPEVVTVPEGGTVQFGCTLESSNVNVDKYTVHWYLSQDRKHILGLYADGRIYRSQGVSERFQLSRDVASNSYILTIRGVERRDSAVYICGIWGKIYGNGTRLTVTSAVVPVLTQSPSLERVTEGHTARLQCTMRNARVSDTDVHWYRQLPGQDTEWVLTHEASGSTRGSPGSTDRLQPSRDTSNNSFILTVTDVQPSDTAAYYCKVWGDISGSGTQLNVTSAVVPVLTQSPSLERVTEGHTARLQCTMRNARVSDTDVHWYRQLPGQDTEWVLTHEASGSTRGSPGSTDRLQPSRDTSNNSFILTVTDVQPSDTAAYYCKVWGDISGNGTQLNVTNPLADPVLVQHPTVSKVPEGETVQLQCAMYNASVSDADVHWHCQRPGNNSEWVMSQFVNGTITRSRGIHDRFLPSRNVTSNSYILTIVNVSLSDTAAYSCSVWSYIYGAGTQLNVTDKSMLAHTGRVTVTAPYWEHV
uniref:immunoglobulin superfamily member 3-like isoform X1 n=1 Tax=Pristiophorus japonicus TaxID=55135 RepID=UPI00398F15A5